MARILTVLSLIIALVLFPPATLALVSSSAVPGDATYGIKRKLEDGILLIASLTPQSKAWFAVERSGRRFKEAAALLAKDESVSVTLTELVDQTGAAARDVTQISDPVKKQQLINQLSQSITQYNEGLSQAAGLPAQIASEPETPQPAPSPVASTTPVPTTTPAPTPAAGLAFSRSSPAPSPTPTVKPVPSTAPKTISPVASSSPVAQNPTAPTTQKQQEVEKTKQELEKVSKFLDEESKKLKHQETKKEETPKVEKKQEKTKDTSPKKKEQ